jgi:hypothetical protein
MVSNQNGAARARGERRQCESEQDGQPVGHIGFLDADAGDQVAWAAGRPADGQARFVQPGDQLLHAGDDLAAVGRGCWAGAGIGRDGRGTDRGADRGLGVEGLRDPQRLDAEHERDQRADHDEPAFRPAFVPARHALHLRPAAGDSPRRGIDLLGGARQYNEGEPRAGHRISSNVKANI